MRTKLLVLLLFLIAFVTVNAQSPTPIIVQAATAPALTSASAASKMTGPVDAQSILAAIKLLEQIKAGNDEVLAKQKAALEKLDELREAADQLRIFAKRG